MTDQLTLTKRAIEPMTAGDLYRLLERRVANDRGNGPEAVIIPEVRNDAGFAASRSIDAVSLGLWPSRGLNLTAYELKVSRGDWLRELRDPAKAEAFAGLVDYIYLVVSDEAIIEPGELPDTWGLLAARGKTTKKLHLIANATRLTPTDQGRRQPLPAGFNRGFLVAMMRQAARQGAATPEAITQAVNAALALADKRHQAERATLIRERDANADAIRAFEQAAGIRITAGYGYAHDPATVGAALRAVLNGDKTAERHRQHLEQLRESAERIAARITAELAP